MKFILLAAAGGALGACARYGVGLAAARYGGLGFPVATLVANGVGGFLMGLLAGVVSVEARGTHIFLGVGVLGGFTTFSAFSIEIVRMMERGEWLAASGYAGGSVVLAIGACFSGLWLARGLA